MPSGISSEAITAITRAVECRTRLLDKKTIVSANSKVKQRDRKYILLLKENDLWKLFLDLLTLFYGELDPE